jgi:hypothetical protein
MSEPLLIRRGRKFARRLTDEEINALIDARMAECGANNNLQARYEAGCAAIAMAARGPPLHLFSTSPKLSCQTRAWESAFSIALAFLAGFQMGETRATLDLEASGAAFPGDDSVLDGQSASACIADLLNLGRSLTDPERFSNAVQDFADVPVRHPACMHLFVGIPRWNYDADLFAPSERPANRVEVSATFEEEEEEEEVIGFS